MQSISTDETKIIYHIDDEETPYLVKLLVPHSDITLSDFKAVLSIPRPNYKYFFKSLDDDFGVVKEEIIDDNTRLPIFKGRVVAWLVTADGSNMSDTNSQCTELSQRSDQRIPHERLGGMVGDSRPPSFHGIGVDHCGGDTTTETESMISSRRGAQYSSPRHRNYHKSGPIHRTPEHLHNSHCRCDSSSVVTSDIETTSFVDSDDDEDDDDINSRISTTTDETSVSRIHDRRHRRRRRRHRMPVMSRTSSISSITESTMSLNIITVTLNLDTVSFLGISIVGQSNKGGDGGIYVGSIMKGGAVALDGRIEPGDMILQVNDVNFEDMSNDDAVRVLREAVQKPGPIKLVVAKCWDPNPKGYFTIPRTEPVRPIDPGAWVAHTEAARAHNQFGDPDYPLRPPSVSTLTSTSSSITSSIPESDRQLIIDSAHLSVDMDMMTIAKSMANPDSGLDVRDRMWLKITIPNALIGTEVVDWLYRNVQGFQDRREARKYANQMLKQGFIKHTVNKSSFSEHCYYVFNESLLERDFANLKVNEDDLPPSYMSSGALIPQYTGNYAPAFMHPWGSGGEIHNYGMFGAQPFNLDGSIHSNSVNSGKGMDNGLHRRNDVVNLIGERQSASPGASSEFDDLSQRSGPIHIGALQQKQLQSLGNPLQHSTNGKHLNGELMHNNHNHNTNPLLMIDGASDQSGGGSTHSGTTTTTTRDTEKQLDGQSSDIGGSRQSFRMAMGNPCEFFVDVM